MGIANYGQIFSWEYQIKFSPHSTELKSLLGHENKIDCFSGIFLRKTHAGCGFFFVANHNHNYLATKNHKHPIQNHMNVLSWYEPWYCGTVRNKIDPCGKLFSHAGSFLVMRDEFYLCGLTLFSTGNAHVHRKTCDHMSSHDIKKQAGSYTKCH